MTNQTDFKVGDVVQLNSGGPPMTISSITNGDLLYCKWAIDEEQTEVAAFRAAMVKKV